MMKMVAMTVANPVTTRHLQSYPVRVANQLVQPQEIRGGGSETK
jgi:hypothetical protein